MAGDQSKSMSSIAKKVWMSLTGVFLITFLVVHLSINLLTLCSDPELFNAASHFMGHNPIMQVMQYVLAAGFIIHIAFGIYLQLNNMKARPVKYAYNKPGTSSPWNSRNMIITGVLVLLFLLLHLKDFFWEIKFGDMSYRSDYELVTNLFGAWYYTLIYVVAFVLLGLHLDHGFQSAFQSIGVNHSRYNALIRNTGRGFSFLIATGFSLIAIYHFIF
jgi:succinate dehydrogenase / fumarate reductase cytochrome b subunit